MRTPRNPKAIRMAGPAPTSTSVSFRRRPGFAAELDTLVLVFDNAVMRGMVTRVSNDVKQHWLTARPLALYEVQIAAVSEGGAPVCTCRPSVKDSGVSALCAADHAVTVESWMDEE